jgi:hypothetical protein
VQQGQKGKRSKKGAGGKGGKGKAEEEVEEKARECLVQELLPVADRFQAGEGGCTSTVWRSMGGC